MSSELSNTKCKDREIQSSRKEAGRPLGVKVYLVKKHSGMPDRETYANRTIVRVSKERVRAAFSKAGSETRSR